MRNHAKINLAFAVRTAVEQPVAELTFAELVQAYNAINLDGTSLRLNKWIQAFGDTSAWDLQAEQLELAAQAMLDHGYKPSTANRDLSNIGSVYKWAREKRMAPRGFRSPTLSVRRFKEDIRRVHLEPKEIERIKARSLGFRDRRFGVFIHLLLDTGARKSEILDRRWADVNIDRGEILAPVTKNGKPRILFFSEQTGQLMQRLMRRRADDALIFEGRVPGQPMDYRASWQKLRTELGIHEMHLHDIRHLAAANLLRAGVTLGVAAQVLGHDPAVLARRYGHLETEALKKAQEISWKNSQL